MGFFSSFFLLLFLVAEALSVCRSAASVRDDRVEKCKNTHFDATAELSVSVSVYGVGEGVDWGCMPLPTHPQ